MANVTQAPGETVTRASVNVTPPTDRRPVRSARLRALAFAGKYGTIVVLIAMIIVFWTESPHAFGTSDNFIGILTNIAPGAIVAAGLTFCLVAGDFDLSVGYQASFGGVLVVGLLNGLGLAGIHRGHPMSIPLAVLAVLVLGGLFGLVNGLIVTRLGVNAFIATLGSGTIMLSLNLWYGKGVTFPATDGGTFQNLTLHKIGGIPYPIIVMVVVLGGLWILLNWTTLGQHVKAVGDDIEAARRLGINVDRTRTVAFVVCGICATGGGVLLASALGGADATAGDLYLLQSFAAAFLGSSALRDGQFHIVGTAIGVFTVAVGFNGLAIFSAPVFAQPMFAGLLLIVAVALGTLSRRYAADV